MHFQEIECFEHALGMLSILQLLREYGKAGDLMKLYQNCELHYDYEWEFFLDALCQSVEFFSLQYIESEDCDENFLAGETMTEYYRLCKEYGRKHGVRFKENPYVIKADNYVRDCMNGINDYGYSWKISTGTRHKYASALHFYRYGDFRQTVQLIQSVLEVFDFYHTEIEVLRKDLSMVIEENQNTPKTKELKAA